MTVGAPARRRVKIIATLGPACADDRAVAALAAAGADGFRLNTAHLAPADIAARVEAVRAAERLVARPLAALCDLAGPKLRLAADQEPTVLAAGSTVTIGGARSGAQVRVAGFEPAAECPAGSRLSLHDGRVALLVRGADAGLLLAEVLAGGEVRAGMGVNLPGLATSLPSLTERDRE